MSEKNQELIDFEDHIRLDAQTLQEALELKKNSANDFYIVGEGISKYLGALRSLGFKDLWQESEKGDSSEIVKLSKSERYLKGRNADSGLMNAYVDYVLNHTDSDLIIFLPEKSGIIVKKKDSGPTYDEIVRTIKLFPKHFKRIHFVTGLYKADPNELTNH